MRGARVEQPAARSRHVDHDVAVEMTLLGVRAVPLLHDHEPRRRRHRRGQVDVAARRVHPGEDGVLREDRLEAVGVAGVELHGDDRQLDFGHVYPPALIRRCFRPKSSGPRVTVPTL